MKVLLVEDQPALQLTLQRSFERRGMRVVVCGDGDRALARWQASDPDVVVLDLTLPGQDGLQVLSEARGEGLETPVLILTARSTVGDRVLGLNTGADDYLAKPFDLDELEARIRALARRRRGSGAHAASHAASVGSSTGASFGGLETDPASQAVYHHGRPLDLTTREAALLQALLASPGRAVAKQRLLEAVFANDPDVHTDAIEVVAYRLRKKLACTEVRLTTLRGLGYLLDRAPDAGGGTQA